MRQELPARALAIKRAATIVGGLSELAQRLNVAVRAFYEGARSRIKMTVLTR